MLLHESICEMAPAGPFFGYSVFAFPF